MSLELPPGSGVDAVATLGLPRWAIIAFGAVPALAGIVTLARDDSSLPFPVELVLVLLALSLFMIDTVPSTARTSPHASR